MSEFISPINPSIEAGKAVNINKARTVDNVWNVSPGDSRFNLQPFSHMNFEPAGSPKDISSDLFQQTSDDPCVGKEGTCSVGFKLDIKKSADNNYVFCAVERQGQDKWIWGYGEEACGEVGNTTSLIEQPAAPVEVFVLEKVQSQDFGDEIEAVNQDKRDGLLDHAKRPYVYGPVAAIGILLWSRRNERKRRREESSGDIQQKRSKLSRTEAMQIKIATELEEKHYGNPQSPLFGMRNASAVVQNATLDLAEESAKSPEYSDQGWIQRIGAEIARRAFRKGGDGDALEVLDTTYKALKHPEGIRVFRRDGRKKRGRR